MVAAATDILSLERARFELRFPDGDTAQDGLLTGLIGSAVSQLETELSVELVDQLMAGVFRLSGGDVVRLEAPFLRRVRDIRYQAAGETQVPGIYPDTMDAAAWNLADAETTGCVIWPTTEWPDAAWQAFRVVAVFGLGDSAPDRDAYAAAAVLLLRALYDGVPVIREESAFDRLTRSLRRYDTRREFQPLHILDS